MFESSGLGFCGWGWFIFNYVTTGVDFAVLRGGVCSDDPISQFECLSDPIGLPSDQRRSLMMGLENLHWLRQVPHCGPAASPQGQLCSRADLMYDNAPQCHVGQFHACLGSAHFLFRLYPLSVRPTRFLFRPTHFLSLSFAQFLTTPHPLPV